ncbi:MAG: SUF system Fe-S cluster assembly protein [Euryhalocaulis sp.]|uniref:SUF system Fe-S cluster assembly protein n=1 Tax=Euryhalocaulis sp. TaxID=2744307 RepID=UPI00182B92C1|nr:SUF system Fe-S cluster assembly protein [Euryhalocaulis sp.]MBA4800367.1 SUF system Fe-S cluster assembly protein [Euryhalocaulis sp.]
MTETVERDIIDLTARPGQQAEPAAEPAPGADSGGESSIPPEELERLTDDIVTALKSVYDPEIPVDIYELGLIYKVDISDDRDATITMTLTAPGCPVAGEMPGWVEQAVESAPGVRGARVEMVFDPPWTPERMSDEAKLELGMF